jgi:hypothetical protein
MDGIYDTLIDVPPAQTRIVNMNHLGRALTVLEALLSKALDLSNLVTAVSVVDDDEHSEVRLCGCLVELNPGQSLRAITERSLP